jgi:Na+/H+ antiporter NhaC
MEMLLSLLPPVVAIILALLSRKVLLSLLVGIWLGAVILNDGNFFLGSVTAVQDYLLPSLIQPSHIVICAYIGTFGGLLYLFRMTGGAEALGNFLVKRIGESHRLGQLSALLFGLLIFFDDYFSCLVVNVTMRPVAERLRIAKEKLAMITDATAAPICLLVPFSTWVIFLLSLLSQEFDNYAIALSPFAVFLKTIQVNFYPIMAIVGTFLVIMWKVSFGPLRKFEKACLEEKAQAEYSESGVPTVRLKHLVVPLAVVLGCFALFSFIFSQYQVVASFLPFAQDYSGGWAIWLSVSISVCVALLLAVRDSLFTLKAGLLHFLHGLLKMRGTFFILVTAWSMASLCKELKSALYLSSFLFDYISASLMPSFIFLLAAVTSFSTGTSYGTFALLLPLAIPMGLEMEAPLEYFIAAILSGAVFGDHSSPLSDTTILASSGAGCEHIDHVITQMPYVTVYAFAASLGFLTLGTYNSPLWALFASLASLATLLLLIKLLSREWSVKNLRFIR